MSEGQYLPLDRPPIEDVLQAREDATLARSAEILAEPGPSEAERAERRAAARREALMWDIIRKRHTNDVGRVISSGMSTDVWDFYCRAGRPSHPPGGEPAPSLTAATPVVRKVREDGDPGWTARVATEKAKLAELEKSSPHLSRGQREEWWTAKCFVVVDMFRKNGVSGFLEMLALMSGTLIGQSNRHDDLLAQMRDLAKENAKLREWVGQLQSRTEAVDRVASRVQIDLATLRREFDLQQKLAVQNTKRKADLLELENSLLKGGRNPDEALPKFSEWRE